MTRRPGNRTKLRHTSARQRRGNVLILVAGILVLLVIVATGYITRTGSERVTSVAVQRSELRDDRAKVIGEQIGQEIAEALFLRQIAIPFGDNTDPDSNAPRVPLDPGAYRYQTAVAQSTPSNQPFYYGAPYHVVPWTNWPLALMRTDDLRGNPGYNDTRWLRDTEPFRFQMLEELTDDMLTEEVVEVFSHWLHMTNIARPENGWRIVKDISDVTDFDGNGVGGLVLDLNIPVEQWLPYFAPHAYDIGTGRSVLDLNDFIGRWNVWFSALTGNPSYASLYTTNFAPPANFYKLADLDGDGTFFSFGDRPQDEFAGPGKLPGFPNGSPRWMVSRVLADADGDGYTDSFWFLSPNTLEGGLRQIVAVSIVDNSGLLNVNAATQFVRAPGTTLSVDNANVTGAGTVGRTPSDLALFDDLPSPILGVGFFTNPENWETSFPNVGGEPFGGAQVTFDSAKWPVSGSAVPGTFLGEIAGGSASATTLASPYGRLDYWRRAGLNPLEPLFSQSSFYQIPYTPFSVADEIELRMYHGNNTPWTFSRLESAIQADSLSASFLHGGRDREESMEYLDQLRTLPVGGFIYDELLHDNRRKLTTYSGARNETAPPWLWWESRWATPPFLGSVQINNFLAQSRLKLDLREDPGFNPDPSTTGLFNFRARLPWALLMALSDNDTVSVTSRGFYYFSDNALNDLKSTRRLAAAYAANILEARDVDNRYADGVDNAVAVPAIGGAGSPSELGTIDENGTVRYLGMEKQPFLVEAFIAHVYESEFTVPPGYTNSGNNMVYEEHEHDTVVVIQIANPHETRLFDLDDYKLSVFDQEYEFLGGMLEPGQTKTFYSFGDLSEADWLDALDIDPSFDNAIVEKVPNQWSDTRSTYDVGDEELAIQLIRKVGVIGNQVDVVIDRIDIHANDPTFYDATLANSFLYGKEVNDLEDTMPIPFPLSWPLPDGTQPFPGNVDIGSDTHWVQYARVARPWDIDLNNNAMIEPNERSPRFIFATRDVEADEFSYSDDPASDPDPDTWLPDVDPGPGYIKATRFNVTDKRATDYEPDDVDLDYTIQMLHRDADFERVGELLNVWLFGHQLRTTPTGQLDSAGNSRGTTITFSEFMLDRFLVGNGDPADLLVNGTNRLQMSPREETLNAVTVRLGSIIGLEDQAGRPFTSRPNLPAGARVLDAFVCDDFGVNWIDVNGNSNEDQYDYESRRFRNAAGFAGRNTMGLININTAPREVLHAAPQGARLIHVTGVDDAGTPIPRDGHSRARFMDAVAHYRDKLIINNAPDYSWRNDPNDLIGLMNLRTERGFASVGEMALLRERGRIVGGDDEVLWNDSWSIRFAAMNPFRDLGAPLVPVDTDLTTDTSHVFDPVLNQTVFDNVASDAEETNVLFAGISNLVTTRSDTFTVYFKVRTFRQNPTTGFWDATDPEYVVDESRYVMLIDRGNVNTPNDKPRIVYLEKLAK